MKTKETTRRQIPRDSYLSGEMNHSVQRTLQNNQQLEKRENVSSEFFSKQHSEIPATLETVVSTTDHIKNFHAKNFHAILTQTK